jgi:hypothetical protein
MTRYSCSMFQYAAAAGVALILSVAAPARAMENRVATTEAGAATARTAPAIIMHQPSRKNRIAASHRHRHDRRVSAVRGDLDCAGAWCGGRQFVLMIGIGY